MMGLSSILRFGKYRGLSVGAIIRFDPRYLSWARENVGGFTLDAAALESLRPALREEREQSMGRQNAWCWGFGRGAREAADARRHRAIRIEHEERRKVGQETCPKCFPDNWSFCDACKGAGWITPPRDSGSDAKHENAERSGAVEPEGSQSGDSEAGASPNTTHPSENPHAG